jgi:prevent-host-death family protein
MKTVGVAQLKANLSRYLERVRHGQEVVVTERGVPVAKIVPLVAAERAPSRREQLARTGLLQLGTGRARASLLKPPKGPVKLGAGVLKALLEERAEGR